MNNLNTIKHVVTDILTKNPETRGDDNLLYIETLKALQFGHFLHLPTSEFLRVMHLYGIPTIESVGRARRKAQEGNSALLPEEDVQGARVEKEIEYLEFARG